MEAGLLYLQQLASSNIFAGWTIPIIVVAVATLVGWAVERLLIAWFKRIARQSNHPSESVFAGVIGGHIIFWGFLAGLAILPSLPHAYITFPTWYPDFLLALFIASLTLLIARLSVGLLRLTAANSSRPVISLITNVVWFIVLVIGFLLVLSLLKVNITPWLTTLGVAGLAVSLALQATLTDLISGMMLLGSRQVLIGHYIKLNTGEEGYVLDITWRTTTLRQLSNNEIVIPNSKMTATTFTNYSTPDMKMAVIINVPVGNTNDLDRVEEICLAVGEEVMKETAGGVPDFTPLVRFNGMSAYTVRFSVILQCQEFVDQYLITSEFIRRVRKRFLQEGVTSLAPMQNILVNDR